MSSPRASSPRSSLALCLFAVLAATLPQLHAATAPFDPASVTIRDCKSESPAEKSARMRWWRDARFGIFIHWGVYSIPAGYWNGKSPHTCAEWIMHSAKIPAADYRKLAPQFNPTRFDANQWLTAIAGSGAKYLVFTSKHHDGFAMYDSAASAYDIVDSTPFKRDVMREIADASRKHGVRFCTYMTILEWDNPTLGVIPAQDKQTFKPFFKAQLGEILRDYQPGILWFDGEWEGWWTQQDGEEIYDYVRSIAPSTILNNRITKSRKGMYGLNAPGSFGSDYGTPEQEIPARGIPDADWEACITMNQSWGFHKTDTHWKSSATLIQYLCDIASKGGNLLLNVGPDSSGCIPQATLDRLAAIGDWLKTNGEAIYATQAGPFLRLPWGKVTRKDNDLFLLVTTPDSGKLPSSITLPYSAREASVTALKSGKSLPVRATPGGLVIDLAGIPADHAVTAFKLTSPQPGKVLEAVIPEADGSILARADEVSMPGAPLELDHSGGGYDVVGSGSSRTTYVKNFTPGGPALVWQVLVPAAGQYQLDLGYSCVNGQDGTPVTLDLNSGAAKLAHTIEATTPKEFRYASRKLGTVQLKAGLNTLTLSASQANSASQAPNAPATPPASAAAIEKITLSPISPQPRG